MRAVRLTQQRVRERSFVVHEKGETRPRGLLAIAKAIRRFEKSILTYLWNDRHFIR